VTAPGFPSHVVCARRGYEAGPYGLVRLDDVARGEPHNDTTWCGRRVGFGIEPGYLDALHAMLDVHNGDHRRLCPNCATAIRAMLDRAAYDPSEPDPTAPG
jgi:hypothetical protein